MKFILYSFILFVHTLAALNTEMYSDKIDQQVLDTILDDLYEAIADQSIAKPDIIIVDRKEKVASYNSYRHQIKVEQSLIDICQSFGDQGKSALAFIIAHELTHAYQIELSDHDHDFHFLNYSKNTSSTIRIETTADIQGAFASYLAGYQNHTLIPELLEQIYQAYDLKDIQMPNYPSLRERKRIGTDVSEKVTALISINELAIYNSLLGNYDLSNHLFEQIIEYYPGGDIHQNIAINYALEAMDLTTHRVDKFIYPFEYEAETRISKPLRPGGSKDLSMEDYKIRTAKLNNALKHFEIAIQKLPNDERILYQMASIYILKEDYTKAITLLDQYMLDDSDHKEELSLVRAIALASTRQYYAVEEARTLFTELSQSEDDLIRRRAIFNLDTMNGAEASCHELVEATTNQPVASIDFTTMNAITYADLYTSESVSVKKGTHGSDLYYQIKCNGKLYIVYQEDMTHEGTYDINQDNIKQVMSLGSTLAVKHTSPFEHIYLLKNDYSPTSMVQIIH